MLKAIHLEPNPFDIDRDLITPTFKLKRPQLLKYYKVCPKTSCHCISHFQIEISGFRIFLSQEGISVVIHVNQSNSAPTYHTIFYQPELLKTAWSFFPLIKWKCHFLVDFLGRLTPSFCRFSLVVLCLSLLFWFFFFLARVYCSYTFFVSVTDKKKS